MSYGLPSVPAEQLGAARLALVEDDDRVVAGGRGVVGLGSNVQVPRWISAIAGSAGAGAKSLASQPELLLGSACRGIMTSFVGMTGPVTSPLPE